MFFLLLRTYYLLINASLAGKAGACTIAYQEFFDDLCPADIARRVSSSPAYQLEAAGQYVARGSRQGGCRRDLNERMRLQDLELLILNLYDFPFGYLLWFSFSSCRTWIQTRVSIISVFYSGIPTEHMWLEPLCIPVHLTFFLPACTNEHTDRLNITSYVLWVMFGVPVAEIPMRLITTWTQWEDKKHRLNGLMSWISYLVWYWCVMSMLHERLRDRFLVPLSVPVAQNKYLPHSTYSTPTTQ